MSWIAVAGLPHVNWLGARTVSEIENGLLNEPSLTLQGKLSTAGAVFAATVARKLKFVPLTVSACGFAPPMVVRLQLTLNVGFGAVPGVIVPLSVVCWPAVIGLGLAEPVAVGAPAAMPLAVTLKSSMAIPWSAPEWSGSNQR